MSNLMIKPGDYVIYKSGFYDDSEYNPLWGGVCGYVYGQIIRLEYNAATVQWENDRTNGYRLDVLHIVKGRGTSAEQHIPIDGAMNTCIKVGRISPNEPPKPKLKLPKDRKKGIFNL